MRKKNKMIEKIWKNEAEPYIIAEISQNHDGSLGQAHAYIDAVASTGADAIKFQTHIAEEESTIFEPFRVKFSYEDNTRYDYWKRMEFTPEQWKGLYDHARDVGIDFLSSPFSEMALDILQKIDVPAWKFGAGEVFNERLLDKAIQTNKPILLSTGLSTYEDIEKQIEKIVANGNKFVLFQCVTAYPSSAEMIDINQIVDFKKRFHCEVGISDHSATIYPSLAATTLGASAIEVHVTMSHYMFGPDVRASVNIEQLKQIVEGTKFITMMRNTHIDLSTRNDKKNDLKSMFSKSLFATRYIRKGEVISTDMFKAKKPNIGIDSNNFNMILGKRVAIDIECGYPLKEEDIE